MNSKIFLESCRTLLYYEKSYKNFIIGDKNVKKRKTPGAKTRACEKRKLVHTDENVAEGVACRGMCSYLRIFGSRTICLC